MRILLVEDDHALRSLLTRRLRAENYAVDAVSDGHQGWEYASTYDYDLLILDVLLPQMDGVSLCKTLRAQGETLPILLLTAQSSRDAKLTGWEAGADDYVVKPFDEAELIARIRALLRRSTDNPLPILTWDNLWINTNTSEVTYGGEALSLTAKEYALLEMMVRDSQHVFSNEEIIESLWASEEFPSESTIRSHIRRLRRKLGTVGAPTDLIATSHGRGYYLKPPESRAVSAPLAEAANGDSSSRTYVLKQADPTAQYFAQLNQTWKTYKDDCLTKAQKLRGAVAQLKTAHLQADDQAEAYRMAHTLSGTLGTFGLTHVMHIAQQIEQEIHPDIYIEPTQVHHLQTLVEALERQISIIETLPSAIAHPPMPSKHDIRVMIVDDDPVFLQLILGQLNACGFEVSTLSDPQQFWPVLESITPDILILDVQMPQASGVELCEKLRSISTWKKLPVMFLSILGDADTQHRAFSAGADDYVSKPITAQNLCDRIHQRLHRIQALST